MTEVMTRSMPVSVRQLVEGFEDKGPGGVVAFNGNLDIRPPYQREFIYKPKQQALVLNTVTNGLPLGVMYWCDLGGGRYEVIDGQQRLLSICRFVDDTNAYANLFGVEEKRVFSSLSGEEKWKVLNYHLQVYAFSGSDDAKLEWFETINISGEPMTKQELRNAVFHGAWLTDAKLRFSMEGCAAGNVAGHLLGRRRDRQEWLESALSWVSQPIGIEEEMSRSRGLPNADELWKKFMRVVQWVDQTFPNKRPLLMRKVDWGKLWFTHFNDHLNPEKLEADIIRLLKDDDITKQAGVYAYVLDGDARHLSIRTFTDTQKRRAFEKQGQRCANADCTEHLLTLSQVEADHIVPWSKGGRTTDDNLQVLCKKCHANKGI